MARFMALIAVFVAVLAVASAEPVRPQSAHITEIIIL